MIHNSYFYKPMLCLLLVMGNTCTNVHAVTPPAHSAEQHELLLAQAIKEEAKKQPKKYIDPKIFSFNFVNEDLNDIINTIAELKKVNVVMPTREADKIKNKVTVAIPGKMPEV